MQIGPRLRELRRSKSLTLKKLSQLSGVDPGTISRIETGKMTGTLKSHVDLTRAMDVNMSELYGDLGNGKERDAVTVQSPESRQDVYLHTAGKSSMTVLTTDILKKQMMPVFITIDPGGETQWEQTGSGTEKFVLQLEGNMEVFVNGTAYVLGPQQTIYFDASLKHHFRNIGKKRARCVCVTSPPAL
ncbi:MAG: cupin domain-containing protein [Candidatus Omnitrophica bacterium]|nr:cupin domain-containing protein [Candidatus Omnitrophota bacterium]